MNRVAPQSGSERGRSVESSEIRTFLIADVRGYTRFSQEHGDAAAARLTAQFAEIAGEAVEAHGGEVVELRGDEVLAVFASARRAIRAAVELQEVLAREVETDPTLPLLAGIGLDAGEVVPISGGYRGRALNLAARLCAKASAGQILATSQVVHLAGQVDGVSFTSLGAVDLKGVDPPVEAIIVARLIDGALQRGEPLLPRSRAEVPVALDSTVPLVRRESELRRLRWLRRRAGLGRGQACLVFGPTGIGKTRLVSELADEAAEIGWTVTYVRGGDPAEVSLNLLAGSTGLAGPAVVIVDDLDASAPAVVDAVEEALEYGQERSVLIIGTTRDQPARIERIFSRARAAHVELPPLDERGVGEIAALYTRGTDLRVPEDVLAPAAGVPALIHRIASKWATDRAAQLVSDAASLASDGRPRLAIADAGVASRVTDLELTRERSQLYLHREQPDGVICPFKGLAPYQPEDADFFFGRERLVAELTARVVGATFLGVVGPSGSGKSSAVKAGLVPALASGVLPHSDCWPLVVIRPGEHPAQALDEGVGRITDDPASRRVVVVDQFEEIFTACVDERERRDFVISLAALSAGSALVVAAVRADYYGRCAAYPELARMFGTNHVLVGPMDKDELRRAIELPARRAGLSVEPELTDTLVADVADQPGALPLLSTKLLELWQLRERRTLTLRSYRDSGGVQAAVAGLAEAAYSKLSDAQKLLARTVLLRMAIVDVDGGVVRRRAHLDEFEVSTDPDAEQVLRVLTDARLLTTSAGYVEVAHEALLREWPRLRDWLRQDAEGTQLHHHLIQAARDWDGRGRDRGDLYRGARLSAALDWTAAHEPALNQRERDFLTASRDAHQRDLRRLRVLLVAALLLMAVALVAGAVAYVQRGSAQRAATVADARGVGAQAQLQPHLDLALLLAREGVALDSTPETRSDLLQTLLRSPQALIIRHIPSGTLPPAPFALSTDGGTLAVGANSGKVLFLDPGTLKIVRSVTPPGGFEPHLGASTIAASPNRPLFAIGGGSSGGAISLLDAHTGRPVGHVMHVANAEFVDAIAFSPNGRTLAAGFMRAAKGVCLGGQGASYLVTRFDVATGKQLQPTTNVTGSYPCGDSIDKLFYSPSGTQLVATDRQGGEPLGRIVVMRASDLKVVRTYPLPGVTAAAFDPQGTTMAVETDLGSLEFLSYPSGVIHRAGNVSSVWSVGYTPDGRSLVTTSADHTIGIWDVHSRTVVATLSGHTNAVTSQAISPDGGTLYTASADGTVIKWDIGGHGSPLRETIPFSTRYPANIFSKPQPTALAVSPNGKLLASSPGNDSVRIWSLKTLQPVGPALRGFHEANQGFPGRGAASLAFSPDSRLLAAGGTHGSTVIVWSVADGHIVDKFVPPTRPHCRAHPQGKSCPNGGGLAFSPNGTMIADGDAANAALIWNLRTHTLTKLPISKGDWIQSLAFSADGHDLIADTEKNHGLVWNPSTRKRIATFEADEQGVLGPQAVGTSKGSRTFVYGSNNSIVSRSSSTGHVIGQAIQVPSGYAGSIALSPDGRTVALTAGDGVEVWDTSTRTEVTAPLPGAPTQTINPGGAGNIAFTPDGRRLLISSPSGLITIWAVAPGVWTRQACQVASRDMTRSEWHKYIPDRSYTSVCHTNK